jgi:nicotinamidase-related amidase
MESIALLVMDVQVSIVSGINLPATFLPLLSKTITIAPSSIKVIYVTANFRPGHPEIVSSNPVFSVARKSNSFLVGAPETLIEPSIAPVEGEIIVEKKRGSAFACSGLDIILRSLGIRILVLAGVSTAGMVLSTFCDATDRDFEIVVLEDLCIDHEVFKINGGEDVQTCSAALNRLVTRAATPNWTISIQTLVFY